MFIPPLPPFHPQRSRQDQVLCRRSLRRSKLAGVVEKELSSSAVGAPLKKLAR